MELTPLVKHTSIPHITLSCRGLGSDGSRSGSCGSATKVGNWVMSDLTLIWKLARVGEYQQKLKIEQYR